MNSTATILTTGRANHSMTSGQGLLRRLFLAATILALAVGTMSREALGQSGPQIGTTKVLEAQVDLPATNSEQLDFRITVSNAGAVPLANVQVADDLGTVFGSQFVSASILGTSPNLSANGAFTGESPNINLLTGSDGLGVGADGFVDVRVIVQTTPGAAQEYTNSETVSADGDGQRVTATATEAVSVKAGPADPDIDIRKQAEGQDSRTFASGSNVPFEIVVTNTGDVPLSNVTVTDAEEPSCDRFIGPLAPGASTTYSCTSSGVTQGFVNIAEVEGTFEPVGAAPILVSDEDPSEVKIASIKITKDGDDDQGQQSCRAVVEGASVTFDIVVTNTGEVPLTNVEVSDPLAPACERTWGTLSPGSSNSYTCTVDPVAGPFTNVATVEGTSSDGTGGSFSVTDVDESCVETKRPAIDIRKQAEGPDSRVFASGSDVPFEIKVTNIGTVTLTNVEVSDVLAPACDRVIGELTPTSSVTYSCTALNVTTGFENLAEVSGDYSFEGSSGTVSDEDPSTVEIASIKITKDGDDDEGQQSCKVVVGQGGVTFDIVVTNTGEVELTDVMVTDPLAPDCERTFPSLAAGATESYTCTVDPVLGPFTNVATVEGTSSNGAGGTFKVTDVDESCVEAAGPGIDIRKQAEGPDSRTFAAGSDVTFEIVVTNIGDVALTNVEVSDVLAPACDRVIGELTPTSSVTYSCTALSVTAGFENLAEVSGDYRIDGSSGTVSDEDPSTVEIASIKIIKDGDDDQGQQSCKLVVGEGSVSFDIVVTNTGEVALTDVEVLDPLAPDCERTFGTLAAGATQSYTCSVSPVLGPFTNEATVNGTSSDGTGGSFTVTDVDESCVESAGPGIDIRKQAEGPDSRTFPYGSDVAFEIKVTNTGDVTLTNVEVSDVLAPACDLVIGELTPSSSVTYSCTVTNVTAAFTNVALVSGWYTPPGGGPTSVTDEDPSTVELEAFTLSIDVTKEVVSVSQIDGEGNVTVVFRIGVKNTSPVTLTQIQLVDDVQAVFGATFVSAATSGSTANLTENPSYDGLTAGDTNLLTGTDDLAPDESGTVDITVVVRPRQAVETFVNPVEGCGTYENTEVCDDAEAEVTVKAEGLAVELTSFDAEQVDGRVVLLWETASEQNSAGFAIEDAFEQHAFEELAWLEASAEPSGGAVYRFEVQQPSYGLHRFRLKMVYLDGRIEYSNEVELVVELPSDVKLDAAYPNPFNPRATIHFAVRESQAVRLELYNMNGQALRTLYEGTPSAGVSQTIHIDGADLPSGTYLVRLAVGSGSEVRTITLLK